MRLARRFALFIAVLGTLLFGAAFALSLAKPIWVEQTARNLIRLEVETRLHEKIRSIDSSALAQKAATLAKGYADEVALAKRLLAQRLPQRVAEMMGEMQNLDCECRKKVENRARAGLDWRVTTASAAHERLTGLIRTQYMDTAHKLVREFRIFTGTNAAVFALLLVAALIRPKASLQLLPAALVLLAAAGVTGYFYLFQQNWLHTLLFNDYVGMGYVGYLSGVMALLSDLIFNRARVTTAVMNAALEAAGSAVQLVPC
jgi:hypothetical protein